MARGRVWQKGIAMEPPAHRSMLLVLLVCALLPLLSSASNEYNSWSDLTKISPGNRLVSAVATNGAQVYVYGGGDGLGWRPWIEKDLTADAVFFPSCRSQQPDEWRVLSGRFERDVDVQQL